MSTTSNTSPRRNLLASLTAIRATYQNLVGDLQQQYRVNVRDVIAYYLPDPAIMEPGIILW